MKFKTSLRVLLLASVFFGIAAVDAVYIYRMSFPAVVKKTPTSICGNAVVEEGEACDLGEKNGKPTSNCGSDCRKKPSTKGSAQKR